MSKILTYLYFVLFLAISGFGETPNEVLAQAKASSLWRPILSDDVSIGWQKLFYDDPVLASWTIRETLMYVRLRTRELNEKSLATQKFVEAERLKAITITDLPFPWKTEKLYWKDTSSIPTTVDFAVASRISEDTKYKGDLNSFRIAFIEADKANPTRTNSAVTARLIFKRLFREKAQ